MLLCRYITEIMDSFRCQVISKSQTYRLQVGPSGKMGFALDNFTSTKVALWSYGKNTCISDTLYFYILAGYNLSG